MTKFQYRFMMGLAAALFTMLIWLGFRTGDWSLLIQNAVIFAASFAVGRWARH